MRHYAKSPRGFSLVELLAAMGIIAILGTIAIAVIGNVKESARSTECITNLRTLHSGFSLYATDKNMAIASFDQGTDERHWHRLIWPYINISKGSTYESWGDAYASASSSKTGWCYTCPSLEADISYVTYGINSNLNGKRWESRADVILLAETQGTSTNPQPIQSLTGSAGNIDLRVATRHSGNTNILFEDGHVDTRSAEEIPDRYTKPQLWGLQP
ncbi:type II secretion system protein [Cerasicoccus frondis]|uniref:type II secretion system protein n=1 Tax=Cerasicoccus frondis TaxID=490090 RepID=UPI002852AB9C|nr:type II secretion system protein [Cerasicoccus frondis]